LGEPIKPEAFTGRRLTATLRGSLPNTVTQFNVAKRRHNPVAGLSKQLITVELL
jgi:hypothetical protein